MKLIKIPKNRNKKTTHKWTKEGLERKRKSARNQMISNNQMDKQETRDKVSMKLKGRTTSPGTLFKERNQYGKLRKNTKVSNVQKMNQSIKMTGKKLHSEEHKKELRKNWKENNPMKDPKIKKKQIERMSKTRKRLAKEGKLPNLFKKGNKIRNGKSPASKGKTKKDFPQLANSGLRKGQTHSGSFKKGCTPWNKGLSKKNQKEVKDE